MVCFLKYWKGLHSCWILNSTQWIRDSRYCISAFVNSESWIQDYSFLFPFYSNEREADFFLWDSRFPELYFGFQCPGFRIHKQSFHGFRNPTSQKKNSRILASRFPHVGSSVSIHSIILLIQISMNAPPLIPFVTSMLIAPILKDPIFVPVRPDSLVMAKPAKV